MKSKYKLKHCKKCNRYYDLIVKTCPKCKNKLIIKDLKKYKENLAKRGIEFSIVYPK